MEEISCLNKYPWITNFGPSFVVPAENFDVLFEPKDFFHQLENSFSKAQRRIYVSSLYFGTDLHEFKLIESIRKSMEQNPSVRLVVLLDHLRASRIDNHQTKSNSRTMFAPLIEQFSSRVDFYLFHTPLLNGFLKKIIPNRINESWGVQHMKVYLVDDDLIISG